MSCGNPHDIDCGTVLDQMFTYLDGELDDETLDTIHGHLDECAPCLRQYGLEKAFRSLVARSCRCSHAPDELRLQILTRISQVRLRTALPAD